MKFRRVRKDLLFLADRIGTEATRDGTLALLSVGWSATYLEFSEIALGQLSNILGNMILYSLDKSDMKLVTFSSTLFNLLNFTLSCTILINKIVGISVKDSSGTSVHNNTILELLLLVSYLCRNSVSLRKIDLRVSAILKIVSSRLPSSCLVMPKTNGHWSPPKIRDDRTRSSGRSVSSSLRRELLEAKHYLYKENGRKESPKNYPNNTKSDTPRGRGGRSLERGGNKGSNGRFGNHSVPRRGLNVRKELFSKDEGALIRGKDGKMYRQVLVPETTARKDSDQGIRGTPKRSGSHMSRGNKTNQSPSETDRVRQDENSAQVGERPTKTGENSHQSKRSIRQREWRKARRNKFRAEKNAKRKPDREGNMEVDQPSKKVKSVSRNYSSIALAELPTNENGGGPKLMLKLGAPVAQLRDRLNDVSPQSRLRKQSQNQWTPSNTPAKSGTKFEDSYDDLAGVEELEPDKDDLSSCASLLETRLVEGHESKMSLRNPNKDYLVDGITEISESLKQLEIIKEPVTVAVEFETATHRWDSLPVTIDDPSAIRGEHDLSMDMALFPPVWRKSRWNGHFLLRCSVRILIDTLAKIKIGTEKIADLVVLDEHNGYADLDKTSLQDLMDRPALGVQLKYFMDYLKFGFFGQGCLLECDVMRVFSQTGCWASSFMMVQDARPMFRLMISDVAAWNSKIRVIFRRYSMYLLDPAFSPYITLKSESNVIGICPIKKLFGPELQKMDFAKIRVSLAKTLLVNAYDRFHRPMTKDQVAWKGRINAHPAIRVLADLVDAEMFHNPRNKHYSLTSRQALKFFEEEQHERHKKKSLGSGLQLTEDFNAPLRLNKGKTKALSRQLRAAAGTKILNKAMDDVLESTDTIVAIQEDAQKVQSDIRLLVDQAAKDRQNFVMSMGKTDSIIKQSMINNYELRATGMLNTACTIKQQAMLDKILTHPALQNCDKAGYTPKELADCLTINGTKQMTSDILNAYKAAATNVDQSKTIVKKFVKVDDGRIFDIDGLYQATVNFENDPGRLANMTFKGLTQEEIEKHSQRVRIEEAIRASEVDMASLPGTPMVTDNALDLIEQEERVLTDSLRKMPTNCSLSRSPSNESLASNASQHSNISHVTTVAVFHPNAEDNPNLPTELVLTRVDDLTNASQRVQEFANVERYMERNGPVGEFTRTAEAEVQLLIGDVPTYQSVAEYMNKAKPSLFPDGISSLEDMIKGGEKRWKLLAKEFVRLGVATKKTANSRAKIWLYTLCDNHRKLLLQLKQVCEEKGDAWRSLGIDKVADETGYPRMGSDWAKFIAEIQEWDSKMTNLSILSQLHLVRGGKAILIDLPIPKTKAMASIDSYMQDIVLPSVNHQFDTIAFRALTSLWALCSSRSDGYRSCYGAGANVTYHKYAATGIQPVTAVIRQVSDVERAVRREMVNNFMISVLIRDFKAEWNSCLTTVYMRAKEDGILQDFVRLVHDRLLDNILGSGFEVWMNSNTFFDEIHPNGILRPSITDEEKQDISLKTHNKNARIEMNSRKHVDRTNRLLCKGIVPYSPITAEIIGPEEFLAACDVPRLVLDQLEVKPLEMKGIPVPDGSNSNDLVKLCEDHNEAVNSRSEKLSLGFSNLGHKVGVNKLHELVREYPDQSGHFISELYADSEILKNKNLWPPGYRLVLPDPGKNGLIFTAALIKDNIQVLETHTFVQNLLVKLQINDEVIYVGCVYHFINNAFDGYSTKFGKDRSCFYDSLRGMRKIAGEAPLIIGGDYNNQVAHARNVAEAKEADKMLECLDGMTLRTGFNSFKRVQGPSNIVVQSAIDHCFTSGISEASASPLDMHLRGLSDGHTGFKCRLAINRPEDRRWEIKRVIKRLDDDEIYKVGMKVDYVSTCNFYENLSGVTYCPVQAGQNGLELFSKLSQPMEEKVIAQGPFNIKRSATTNAYLKYAIALRQTIENLAQPDYRLLNKNKIISRCRRAWTKMNLVVRKMNAADRRLLLNETDDLSRLSSQCDSWKLANKFLKKENPIKFDRESLETIADELLALQHKTKPPEGQDGIEIEHPKLSPDERYTIERVLFHKNKLLPSFMEAYSNSKCSTNDLNFLSRNLVEKLPINSMLSLVLRPVKSALEKGTYLAAWLMNKIRPIFKSCGQKFRPITVTAFLGGLVEKLVGKSLTSFLLHKGLIPSSQYGFREGHSCAGAAFHMERLVNSAAVALAGEGRLNPRWTHYPFWAVITADASNAFGVIPHSRFLKSLEGVVAPSALRFFREFLPRSFRCVLNGFASGERVLPEWGLPQGSALSPICYAFYTGCLIRNLEIDPIVTPAGGQPVPTGEACSLAHPASSAILQKGNEHLVNGTALCSHGYPQSVGCSLSFADDSIIVASGMTASAALRSAGNSATLLLAKMRQLGIQSCARKTHLMLFGKSQTYRGQPCERNLELNSGDPVELETVVEGMSFKPAVQTKYLGIFLSVVKGFVSFATHWRYLKGRFKQASELLSTIFFMLPQQHMVTIVRSLLLGVALHGTNLTGLPDKHTLRSLQRISNNTILGKRSRPFYMIDQNRAEKFKNKEAYETFRTEFYKGFSSGFCPELPYWVNYRAGVPHIHFSLMKQAVVSVYKVFRMRIPKFPVTIIAKAVWVARKDGTLICPLPDVFLEERLEKTYLLESRFGHNRVPGILLGPELANVRKAVMLAKRIRSIMGSPELEIRMGIPKEAQEAGFVDQQKTWPGNYVEIFNSIPSRVRSSFVGKYFSSEMKTFIETCHYHEEHSFKCSVCDKMKNVPNPRGLGLTLPLSLKAKDGFLTDFESQALGNERKMGTQILMLWCFASGWERSVLCHPEIVDQFYSIFSVISLKLGLSELVRKLLCDLSFSDSIMALREVARKNMFTNKDRVREILSRF